MASPHLEGCYTFRRALLNELVKDLIGPQTDDEVIHDAPLDQYVTGILYPARERANAAEDDGADTESGGDESAASDPPVAMANVRNPSSIGITFAVGPDAGNLIHELVVAATADLTIDQVSQAVHIHPTLAEGVNAAAGGVHRPTSEDA